MPDSLGGPEGPGHACFAFSGVTPETAGDGWKEDILKENGLPADLRQPQPRPQGTEIRGPVRGSANGKAGRGETDAGQRGATPPPGPGKGN